MSFQPLSVFSAAYGMNMVGDEALFSPQMAGRFTSWARNLRLENGQFRTRYAWHELEQVPAEDLDHWHAAPTQGAILYRPRVGQGAHYQGLGQDRIVEAAGGALWEITPGANETIEIRKIPGAQVTPRWALAWLEQAENYVLRSDGSSSVVIWDGQNPATFSSGFSRSFPEAAKVPNGAGPILYHAGRLWVTVLDRQIYPGDVLHKYDQLDAVDVLSFEDQAIDATAAFLIPPSSEGNIVALVPASGRDLEEIMVHCNGPGIAAIRTDLPRTAWSTNRLMFNRSHETAAAGPYCVASRDGGSLHRSAKGIEDVRILEQDKRSIGTTSHNLGAAIAPILRADYEPDLLFASLINPPTWSRMLTTVGPWTDGLRRGHRGLMACNWNPGQVEIASNQFAWEGGMSLPPQFGEVVQLLEGRVKGQHRIYAITWDGERKHILEWTHTDGPDLDASGAGIPIEWQLISRKLINRSEFTAGDWKMASLRLKDVRGTVRWEAWVRTDRSPDYQLVKRGQVRSTCDLGTRVIPLGLTDERTSQANWAQWMVRGTGVATIDLAVEPGESSSPELEGEESECLIGENTCLTKLFEYQLS